MVLSVARSALGAPQVPPTTAVTGLALVLTLAVMAPVGERRLARGRAGPPARGVEETLAAGGPRARAAPDLPRRASPAPTTAQAFLDLARRLRPADPARRRRRADLAVLAPAFVVSELRRAFTIGFLVFLPFLVVDLVVANVLLALGLTQLSPTTVSLPLQAPPLRGRRRLAPPRARASPLAYAP